MKNTSLTIAALLVIILSSQTNAQTLHWEQTLGISGGAARVLSVGPDGDLYACVNDSIFHSTDKGIHWRDIRSNIGKKKFSSVNCTKSNTLFATYIDGIYRSIDKGNSWNRVFGNSTFYDVQSSKAGYVYALGYDTVSYSPGICLFISTDDGTSWRRCSARLEKDQVNAYNTLSISPSGHLFLRGIFARSTDNGNTWVTIAPVPAPRGHTIRNFFSRVVFASDDTCYAAIQHGALIAGIPCRSVDGGVTWTFLDSVKYSYKSASTYLLALDVAKQVLVVKSGNCNKTSDGGKTWALMDRTDNSYPFAFAIDSTGSLYVGTMSNIYRMDKGDSTWQLSNPNLGIIDKILTDRRGNILTTIVRTETPGSLNKIGPQMFMVSTVESSSWKHSESYILSLSNYITGLTLDTSNNFLVQASGSSSSYLSRDGGLTWKHYHLSISDLDIEEIALSHSGRYYGVHRIDGVSVRTDSNRKSYTTTMDFYLDNLTTFHAIKYLPNGWLFLGMSDGIAKMKDGDSLWARCDIPNLSDTVKLFYYSPSGILYAGTNGQGIFMSEDNGESWQQINSGLSNLSVTSITGDEYGNIYCSSTNGVFLRTKFSNSWQDITGDIGIKHVTALCYVKPNNLYAGTRGQGIFRASIEKYNVKENRERSGMNLMVTATTDPSFMIVSFTLSENQSTSFSVVDILGRSVYSVASQNYQAGINSFLLPTGNLPSGLFFMTMKTDSSSSVASFMK